MGVLTSVLVGTQRRDTLTSPVQMVGFPTDGGLVAGGVTTITSIGLSAVWRCLDILANGISQLEWRERRGNLDLPSSRLVARPQAQRTRREWVSIVVSTLALYDVCYLLKTGGTDSEGVPIGLWYMDPRIVMPATTNLFDTLYLLPPDEYFVAQQRVQRDQLVILHRSPQPTISDTAGGIINLARTTFAAALAAERYASRYWQAGGSPTTVLETEQRLTPAQVDDTSEKWAEKRSRGPDFAPVLHGGLHARAFGADPTSESAVEARRELVADIGRYFGIPTRILNAPTGDSQTYTSTAAANGDLIRYTLQNYIGAIEDAISEQLPGGRRMEMDPRRLVRGTQYEQAQTYQLATGGRAWMTPGDVRDEVGLAPLEDPVHLEPLGEQVKDGRITIDEARGAMNLPPMQWEETPTTDELAKQIDHGLLTIDEARALMKLPTMQWADGPTPAEVTSLLTQLAAGVLTHDEVREMLKRPVMRWPEELGPDEVTSVIAQVKAGLLTENEARELMKRPPLQYSDGPSPDDIASMATQIHEGLLTIDEARAQIGMPPAVWPEDLNSKIAQAVELIKAGFEADDVLHHLGLPPIKHLGLPPISLQKLADAEGGPETPINPNVLPKTDIKQPGVAAEGAAGVSPDNMPPTGPPQ